jgi:hypothetical protein
MTRREFTATVATAAVIRASTALAQTPPAIDQNPIRRRGVGLRGLDAARASAGFTLFAPMRGDGAVYLIDLSGNIVHQSRMPYPPGLYGYLTERGTLFYNGKIPNDTFLGRTPFKEGVALEGNVRPTLPAARSARNTSICWSSPAPVFATHQKS